MDEELFELEILSPEKTLFKGFVEQVMFPGAKAPFTVLYNHAPLVSTLSAGNVKWKVGRDEKMMAVKGGFVEVRNNKVNVLVEA